MRSNVIHFINSITGKAIIVFCLFCILASHNSFAQKKFKSTPTYKLKALAKNSLKQGDVYSAIDYLEEYCKKKESVDQIYLLATCYQRARNYTKAIEFYAKTIQLAPNKYPLAIFYYGQMLKTNQQYTDASKLFNTFKKNASANTNGIDYKRLVSNQIIACDTAPIILKNPSNHKIYHLSKKINKASIEFSPQYINDTTLLFASLRSDTAVYQITTGEMDTIPSRKFYTATFNKNKWRYSEEWKEGKALNEVNTQVGNGVFSADKKRFYFTRCTQNYKLEMQCKICVSKKLGNYWSSPTELPAIINEETSSNTQPAIGINPKTQEEVLYFSSNRYGTKGGFDIWYSTFNSKKNEWKEPKNCGTKINTPGDEISPFFDVKTKNLYFSSNGLPGLGEFDIFKATGELAKWLEVQNIGSPINTPYDDLYFIIHPLSNEGFFTSNRPGSVTLTHPTCCDDIYYFQVVNKINLAVTGKVYQIVNTKIQNILNDKTEDATHEKELAKKAEVSLYTYNPQTKEKILIAKDSTNEKGKYQFELEQNKNYELVFESDKKPNPRVAFNTKNRTKSDTIVVNDVEIESMPMQPIVIKNIYYDFDKSKLRSESEYTIDTTLLKILREFPEIIIEVSSHTDSKGDDEYNLVLSQKRAESVVKYLIKNGIPKERLVAKGYGETKPIAPNENNDGTDNPEGRQKNRRTEFKIIGTLDIYSEIIYEE